ncbi:unnamed protein product [Rotaria magnacalcarata]|uniref:IRG-type G domain-containing protein n=1 Tax=Rotaria magnacalcarata TaxID=392030 RepID=A0A820GDC5_9BILA|nr:unnamed protein product [Rotaria magnacalcarata]
MALATASDENIDHEIMGQMVTLLEAKNGVAGYAQFLKERLEGWKEYLLRIIALTGSSGQAGRFTEEDIWLVKQIMSLNKKFYFIRTKIDQDLRNSKDDHPDTYKEDIILQQIRENCEDELKKALINNSCNENKQAFKIFLIGAIVCSITNNSAEIIKERARFLRDKIWKVASCSRLLGAVPIIGTSLAGDAPIVYKCYEYCNQASGLDDGSLTTLANIHNTTIAAIKAYMSTTVWSGIFFGGQVASFIIIQADEKGSKNAAQKAASKLSKATLKFIPFVGNVVTGVISFDATYHRLYCLINKMEEATITVLQFITKQTGDSELIKLKTDQSISLNNIN